MAKEGLGDHHALWTDVKCGQLVANQEPVIIDSKSTVEQAAEVASSLNSKVYAFAKIYHAVLRPMLHVSVDSSHKRHLLRARIQCRDQDIVGRVRLFLCVMRVLVEGIWLHVDASLAQHGHVRLP